MNRIPDTHRKLKKNYRMFDAFIEMMLVFSNGIEALRREIIIIRFLVEIFRLDAC